MRLGDRLLQRWRIAKARPYISRGSRVLDIGCTDGALFRLLAERIEGGVGLDPDLREPISIGRHRLLPGTFPEALTDQTPFDVIAILAVLEHIPAEGQQRIAASCVRWLNPGGYIVVTVPALAVDRILRILRGLRIVDAATLKEHYGFEPHRTIELFTVDGLRLIKTQTFQLGLNNLFVFQKRG